jgi:predicted HAD superfamily phosphohydrolase
LVLGDLTDERIARAPEEFARLIIHLLSGTQPPFYEGYGLPEVVARLAAHGVSEQMIEQIAEWAIRLGIDLDAP